MVRILHAAMHTMNPDQQKAFKLIKKINAMSVELTEMSRARDQGLMHLMLGDDYYTFQRQFGFDLLCRDVSIILKKHRKITPGTQTVEKSSSTVGLRKTGIGMSRYQRSRTWTYRGQEYAHIGIHWNAAIQNRKTGAPLNNKRRIAMNRAGMQLDAAIKQYKEDGCIVFVSGDPNWRTGLPKSDEWQWAPQNILEANGMAYRSAGLDILGWPKNTFRKVKVSLIPKEKNFGDHDWLLGSFVE